MHRLRVLGGDLFHMQVCLQRGHPGAGERVLPGCISPWEPELRGRRLRELAWSWVAADFPKEL